MRNVVCLLGAWVCAAWLRFARVCNVQAVSPVLTLSLPCPKQRQVRLYNYWLSMQGNPQGWASAQAALLAAPPSESFAKRNPTYEGVCMGNRKTCQCGAPFFS